MSGSAALENFLQFCDPHQFGEIGGFAKTSALPAVRVDIAVGFNWFRDSPVEDGLPAVRLTERTIGVQRRVGRGSPHGRSRTKMIIHSESDAQIVLRLGIVVGQLGSDIVGLKQAHGDASREEQVDASAGLQGKRVGRRRGSSTGGKGATEGMHAPEQRLTEDLQARPFP